MDPLDVFLKLCHELGLEQVEEYVYRFSFPGAKKTLLLSALIHGNETGSLHLLIRILQSLGEGGISPSINILFSLGNLSAYHANKRFITHDLNRSFGAVKDNSFEIERAQVLKKILAQVDVMIDFHQTLEPVAKPFFLFPFNEKNILFANALDPSVNKITYQRTILEGTTFSGAADAAGISAITIETGLKGFDPAQINYGFLVFENALEFLNPERENIHSSEYYNLFTWAETVSNPDQQYELVSKFENFEPILKDSPLAHSQDGKVLKSPIDGFIIFPKYGENRNQSKELVSILKSVKSENDLA